MANYIQSAHPNLDRYHADTNQTNSTNLDLLGYSGLLVASVFWGGNNLPIKHYETGNGMFFQFIVGIAVWSTGLVVHWVRGFPKFYALPLVGGALWSTGNLQTVPVIRCLGIGVGSLFWSMSGLVVGWSYARFGLFGVDQELPSNITLNYIGVALTLTSCVIFLFVKVEEQKLKTTSPHGSISHLIEETNESVNSSIFSNEIAEIEASEGGDMIEQMSPLKKKILGTILSIFAGVMFGLSYLPNIWCEDNIEGASKNFNDYAFSMSTGIFLTSTMYFLVYCVWSGNKPKIYPELVFPSLVTGWLWGIANTAYFISSDILSQTITFPITNTGPAVVAFILSLFYREIKGCKNLSTLAFGLFVAISGIICCGLSY